MDFSRLLEPVESDPPSGAELRNDPRFHAIERLLEPAARENRLNEDGTVNFSAPDVDWQQVIDDAFELAKDGRDLRLLVKVVRAANRQEGFQGLSEGLELLKDTVTKFWDTLHPALRDRPDAKMASLPRTNAMRQLENDDNGLLGDLKYSILLNPRGIGPVVGMHLAAASWSEFDVVNNAASGLSQEEKDAIVAQHNTEKNRVVAACRAMAAEDEEKTKELVSGFLACEEACDALAAAFNEAAGFGSEPGLTFDQLKEFLAQMRATIEAAIAETSGDEAASEGVATTVDGSLENSPAQAANQGVGGVPGTIGSRADVENALDKIIAFYQRTEPASPIPHLLRRIKKIVPMDFMALMEEVAPSGVKEFRSLAGIDEPSNTRRRSRVQRDNDEGQ